MFGQSPANRIFLKGLLGYKSIPEFTDTGTKYDFTSVFAYIVCYLSYFRESLYSVIVPVVS